MNPSKNDTYVVTGPTSGIGFRTAMDLAAYGTLILVGRDRGKLDGVREQIERAGGKAFTVVCDLSDPASVQRAAREIIAIGLPITGLLNNAGVMLTKPGKNALGWDLTFATNHLGPFALTEALVPHLPDGANVLFVASGGRRSGAAPGQGHGHARRAVYLDSGERAGRMATAWIQDTGHGRLCDVKAVHPRLRPGAFQGITPIAHQRR
jgi:NAD(P)-dependent dehydrogenase (short-subunit alcohol dehydrogenase family)